MNVLLTCGAGDFLALESWLSAEEKSKVRGIYYATRSSHLIIPVQKHVFPNVEFWMDLVSDWDKPGTDGFCVETGELLSEALGGSPWDADWSIAKIIAEAMDGKRTYTGSSVMRAMMTQPPVTNDHRVAIHPCSSNAPAAARDMNDADWKFVMYWLKRHGLRGLVLGSEQDLKSLPPAAKTQLGLLSRSNIPNPTLEQSLRLVCASTGFLGCASVMSVAAAHVLNPRTIRVKCHDTLRDEYQWFYYPRAKHNIVFPHLQNLPAYMLP